MTTYCTSRLEGSRPTMAPGSLTMGDSARRMVDNLIHRYIIEPSRLYNGPPPRGPDDPPPRSTAVIDAKANPPAPQAVSAAEAERRRLAVNADRSAYQQQGLRPAGGEPWRGHVGGVDESFFDSMSPGRCVSARAWRIGPATHAPQRSTPSRFPKDFRPMFLRKNTLKIAGPTQLRRQQSV